MKASKKRERKKKTFKSTRISLPRAQFLNWSYCVCDLNSMKCSQVLLSVNKDGLG